jgi:hypothetical protein
VQLCVFAHGVTFDFQVFEELVDLLLVQGHTKGSDFIQTSLCSLQEHNLELPKLVDTVTYGAPSVIVSKKMARCLFISTCKSKSLVVKKL